MGDNTLKVRVHPLKDGIIGPVLATFPQGPPSYTSLGISSTTGIYDDTDSTKNFEPLQFSYQKYDTNNTKDNNEDNSNKSSKKRANQRQIIAENNEVRYEGKNFGNDVGKSTVKYAIGLYNRKRKRLDVYETESNGIIFNLGITSVTNRDGTTTYDNNDLTEVSAKARRDMLIESFGSRKKKAMERSKAANIVDVAAVAAAEQVAATLRESSTTLSSTNSTDGTTTTTTRPTSTSERKVTEALNIARRAMLPPYNELASIPDDVYPFDGIITNEEVDTIQYTTNNILRAISTKDKTALEQLAMVHARGSEYVRDRLFRLSENDDSNKHKSKKHHDDDTFNDKSVLRKRVRALLYLKCLLALHRAPNELRPRTLTNNTTTEGDGTENNDNTNTLTDPAINNITQEGIPQLRWIPAPIQTRMLSLFTEQRVNTRSNSSSSTTSTSNDTIYVRTPDLIDKLITWIACLSLIIDGYTTDLRLLATDMRLPPVRLLHFYKELGCNATPIRSNVPGNTVDEDNEEDNDKTSSGRSTVISYTVALHVPLNFPKPKIGRARG